MISQCLEVRKKTLGVNAEKETIHLGSVNVFLGMSSSASPLIVFYFQNKWGSSHSELLRNIQLIS